MVDDIYYMIVYPRGNKTSLSVATVQWFDENDYALASHKKFIDEKEAIHYCSYLAAKNGLAFECQYKILD